MGLRNAIDVALSAGVHFMMFFRQMWSAFPLVVQMLIFMAFGLAILFGLMKMLL